MNKNHTKKSRFNKENEYLLFCLHLNPAERFKKGIELSVWAKRSNKYYNLLFEEELKDYFLLR